MQLDQTRIAVRERSIFEILDLALRVVRTYFFPWAIVSTIGAAPFLLLNWLLLPDAIPWDPDIGVTPEFWLGAFGYASRLALFMYLEYPLATALATLYLGQALFLEKPGAGRLIGDWLRSLPQLVFCQVLLRGLIMLPAVTAVIPYFAWPYLNEVILLERNPLFSKAKTGTTTFKRSSSLHMPNLGDLFARGLVTIFVGALLLASCWAGIGFIRFWIFRSNNMHAWVTIDLSVAIWIVVGYFTVVRFLSYLDLRIKNEGWEVELALRAEGARLTRQLT